VDYVVAAGEYNGWSTGFVLTNSPGTSNYGQVGFTQNTLSPQTAPTPTVSLTNPFPAGLVQPLGSSLGPITGAGTNIAYTDQNSTAPRVQQYSVDLQRELPHNQSITFTHGRERDHLGLGEQRRRNQHQPARSECSRSDRPDPEHSSSPFFGVAARSVRELGHHHVAALLRPSPPVRQHRPDT
jgi:hypothetical protein